MSIINTERLTKILSETQAVITECSSRSVHGSVEVNARLFENVLMELLRHRAAMLQGADGKPELTVWYGAMPETNGKTNWTAMLHREGQHPWEGITIDRSEYPDRVRYEADRMRHLIGELADKPDILAYDADAHSGYVYPGNPPVIPDGWVSCSERMPETMVSVLVTGTWFHHTVAFWDGSAWCDLDFEPPVTHWMPLPAAPQQEVKP